MTRQNRSWGGGGHVAVVLDLVETRQWRSLTPETIAIEAHMLYSEDDE